MINQKMKKKKILEQLTDKQENHRLKFNLHNSNKINYKLYNNNQK